MSTVCPRCRGAGEVISNPCDECRGSGLKAARREIAIDIPAGIDDGQQIRLSGEGDHGQDSAPPGDLYVQVHVKEHALFHREGRNLVFEMPVTFTQAALGDEVEVPTIWGKAALKIPAGIQSGTLLRLKGEGMPEVSGGRRGDQAVLVRVETPRKLTAKQKELLREFAETENGKANPEHKSFFDKLKEYFSNEE